MEIEKISGQAGFQAQAAQAAGAGPDMSGFAGAESDATANSADDDVIDADFKEV